MSGETHEFHVGFKYKASNMPPIEGKPAWRGMFLLDGSGQWFTVVNSKGQSIGYTSRVSAEQAALREATAAITGAKT